MKRENVTHNSTISCTVGIITRNSEKTLSRALESVKRFEEIIICDGYSTDRTREIAKQYGAHILDQDPQFLDADGRIQNFASIRNQTVAAATHKWFVYIDSDEFFSTELVDTIGEIVAGNKPGAFFFLRQYIWRGEKVTCATTYPNWSMRLIALSETSGFRKCVHERFALRDGVEPVYVPKGGYVYVPIGDGQGPNPTKGDYYIQLQVRESLSSERSFYYIFAKTCFNTLKVSVLYGLRYVRIFLICRGVRMPMFFEWERHRYHIRLITALWRARNSVR